MVDSSYCISIDNINELEEYKELLADIIDLAHDEMIKNINGGMTVWNIIQLEGIVIPEMTELFDYLLKGELFLKYGKQQRLLESTYLLTDSFNGLCNSPLGIKIRHLQQKIDSWRGLG